MDTPRITAVAKSSQQTSRGFQPCNSLLKKRLIDNKIFVATYWPNVLEWCKEDDIEYKLCKSIIPIPIDQRYGKEDMNRILEIIQA